MLIGKKGIVLITTMMAICLTFMMVVAVVQSSGMGLMFSTSFYERESALQAAQSGLDYAVTRLQHHKTWRGDSNRSYWDGTSSKKRSFGSSGDKFQVCESNGNVVGLIESKNGTKSGFRIKFSFEANDDETLKKISAFRLESGDSAEPLPVQEMSIAMPYVSLNNLDSERAALVYRANNNGVGVAEKTVSLEKTNVDKDVSDSFAMHLPAQRACLVVEGLAGKGLRDCKTPEDVNAAANRGDVMSHRYVEAYYTKNAPVLKGQAALAEKTISFNVADKMFVRSSGYQSDKTNPDDKSTVPESGNLRSNTSYVAVTGGTLNTYNGTLYHGSGDCQFNVDTESYEFLDSKGKKQKYTFPNIGVEKSEGGVETVDWEQVAKADNVKGNVVMPGFYQWHTTADSTPQNPYYELRYYPDGFKPDSDPPEPQVASNYKIAVCGEVKEAGDADKKISIGPAEKMEFITDDSGHITEPTISLKGKLYCNGDFTISSDTTEVTSKCPLVMINDLVFEDKSKPTEYGVFMATGDISLISSVKGFGAVVSQEGNVSFIGESMLDSGSEGVAIYGYDVNLKSLELAVEKAPDGSCLDSEVSLSAGSVYRGVVDKHGNGSFDPQNDIFPTCKQYKKEEIRKEPLRQYIADTYGIYVEVDRAFWQEEHDRYRIDFYFCDSHGNRTSDKKRMHAHKGYTSTYNVKSGGGLDDVSKFVVPKCSLITECDTNVEQPPYIRQFDKICYGDQNVRGVIYARRNFNAELNNKFNLVVTGSIRAETGNISGRCNSIDLNYDESSLDRLMPGYSRLSCVLWNCW